MVITQDLQTILFLLFLYNSILFTWTIPTVVLFTVNNNIFLQIWNEIIFEIMFNLEKEKRKIKNKNGEDVMMISAMAGVDDDGHKRSKTLGLWYHEKI